MTLYYSPVWLNQVKRKRKKDMFSTCYLSLSGAWDLQGFDQFVIAQCSIRIYISIKMDDYSCNQCLKTYRYRRNLNRHISECHQEVDWWRCTEFRCNSKFKRRSFLFTHLAQTHQFKKHVAREKVLYAQRSSIINQTTSYYEDISSDEDILKY